MRRILLPAIAGLALVGVTACSPDETDFADSAEDFIEDDDEDVATELGMTFDDAECDEPASTEVGATFTCTASGSDGNSYTFTAEIDGDNSFRITSFEQGAGGAAEGTTAGTAGATATTGG
jgi:hypothetical protein